MRARFPFFCILIALLALAASSLSAQDGLRGALSAVSNTSGNLQSPFEWKLVAADFDNDQEPDGALLQDAGVIGGQRVYRIELHVTAGENQSLVFASSDPALAISALDVNRDGSPDLIVEQAFTHKRLQVWLNDGHGSFRQARAEDFSQSDTPGRWQNSTPPDISFVLGLPSRTETHQALELLQILRFSSSSSHWKARPDAAHSNGITVLSRSPRAPPACLFL